MKWILMCYVLVIVMFYGFGYYMKKKKNRDIKKVFLFVVGFLNVLFLGGIAFSYWQDYRNGRTVLEENRTLLTQKEEIEEKTTNVKQEVERLEENIVFLDYQITELEETKGKVNKEIETLEKQYNTLYVKMQNTPLFQIANFPTFDQRKDYPNGCESIALYLLLKYHGVNVTPEKIVNALKKGDPVHVENGIKYGGDPEIEFIGNPKSKSGYGVFENPIIDVANQFKPGIVKATGKTLDEVLEIVKSGKPVQVWASSYGRTPNKCNTWTHKESGKTITWYCNFHSLVLIGATSSKVIVSDSLTGTIVNYDKKKFEYAYDFYGKRAIYYE